MFKKLLKGLDSAPPTPKIGRIELPELGEGDVFYFSKAEGSAIVDWSSDSEGSSSPRSPILAWHRPSTPQPEGPLKSRRKHSTPVTESPLNPRRGSASSYHADIRRAPSRSTTPMVEPKSNGSRSSTPQPGSSKAAAGLASPVPVKAARKGILKPSPPPKPVTLHWQLLPYEPGRSKKLIYFNVAYPPGLVRDHTRMPPVSLHQSEMEKQAAEIPLGEMQIRCSQLPHWDVIVSPVGPGGVRCIDVYRAIYETFQKELSETERDHYIPHGRRQHCEAAWRKRCKEAPGLPEVNLKKGMCRIDLLEGRTIFMGLRRPVPTDDKPDRVWVLELGFPKEERR
ncbi:uncharacterized protein B0H18DRAFT_950751 [Fomitopsis serialis]|uniref:uncharacterized protein n=1 Tax=Fomitopsis serialis TaxID=139415 RepID=UPI002008CC01|nr:uncharacterized protein B0H18DRAFT_950751 [Neoantrodia serialis]KAH9936486.1 hypothetical protein B0H18DRAFT_950751 [Neoantrodia serialis]